MGRKPKQKNLCVDCGIYALKRQEDYFIVTDELWEKFGVGRGLLCWSCFQLRMGRKFRVEDFIDCNANNCNPLIKKLRALKKS